MPRFRHLYIDSRYRTVGSDSDFSINLQDTVELEAGARCWVAGVTSPNVFYTIEENVNDTFYAAIRNGATTGGYAFKLAYGNYGGAELAAEMQAKLWTVEATAQVSYTTKTGRVTILMSAGRDIKVVSDEELTSPAWLATWTAYSPTAFYDMNDPKSFNEVLRAEPHPFSGSYISQLIQVQPFHTLYLHSSMTTFDGIDAIGRSGIIARIPMEKTYGFVNHYQGPFLEQGFFDVSNISFRNLRFSLRNARGAVVPLHGAHISIHLVFD